MARAKATVEPDIIPDDVEIDDTPDDDNDDDDYTDPFEDDAVIVHQVGNDWLPITETT